MGIALCEMGEVAKQEPRLKHYLPVNRNACKCRPACWPEYQIKPEQIPPIEVPQSFLNPKYNPPKEEPIRKPKILSGWPTVDDKVQHPVPVRHSTCTGSTTATTWTCPSSTGSPPVTPPSN